MSRHEGAEMGMSPIERYKNEIALQSKHTRIDLPEGNTQVESPEGKIYNVEQLENHKDPRVAASHELLSKTFGEDEMDSLRTIKAAMQGKVVGDEKSEDIPLMIHTVENEKEVVGTAHTAVLEAMNDDFEPKGNKKSIMLDAYLAVKKGEQYKDLDIELYRKRAIDAQKFASENGLKMDSMVVEATADTSEEFYNKVGMHRLYMETKWGELKEVPYFQSVLADAWNESTGDPRRGEARSALHLMIGQLDGGRELTPEQVLEKVRALMDYDSFQTKDYFSNKNAHAHHEDILEYDLGEFEKALGQADDGTIKLMTAEERDEWIRINGKDKFVSHITPSGEKNEEEPRIPTELANRILEAFPKDAELRQAVEANRDMTGRILDGYYRARVKGAKELYGSWNEWWRITHELK
ncbi:MAG: hypothetical protein V1668_03515 [Patescibacteria group bacterium]